MLFNRIDNGNCIPAAEERTRFAEFLWTLICNRVLEGHTKIIATIEGECLSFQLPPPTQILDFVSMRESDAPDTIDVHVEFPGNDVDRSICCKTRINFSTD